MISLLTISLLTNRLIDKGAYLGSFAMVLVEYSESEGSELDDAPTMQEPLSGKTSSKKPTFQKVVDRSNPHRVKVSLPGVAVPAMDRDSEDSERPTKRTKFEGSGLSGFNALLPAPKSATASNMGARSDRSRKGGLASGVNLKTGAAPGFSRDPAPTMVSAEEKYMNVDSAKTEAEGNMDDTNFGNGLDFRGDGLSDDIVKADDVKELSKPKRKAIMFKPLSVTRRPQKKKATADNNSVNSCTQNEKTRQTMVAPKASLFSIEDMTEASASHPATTNIYRPVVYDVEEPVVNEEPPEPQRRETREGEEAANFVSSPSINTLGQSSQSLMTIASDLNLSASAKRQLLGRQKDNSSAINIVNFNTDEEYKQNELMRQTGEVVQHNTVRAIAPGKHSLKQLVNAASTQKDALEESFASGRRNKKEAGSKYGW